MRPITGRSAVEQLPQPGRAVDRQRPLARAQVERLEHPEQAEPVVEVEVREEDRVERPAARPSAAAAAGCPRRSRTGSARRRARSSSAGRPRRAVGTEPAVPAKKSERSMGASEPSPGAQPSSTSSKAIRPSVDRRQAHRVARRRRRSVGEPGLKIAKPSRASCSGMCECPKTTASASGKRPAHPLEAPGGRAGVVDHRDPRAAGAATVRALAAAAPELGVVHVAVHGVHRRPERLEPSQHRRLDEVAGVQDRVGLPQPLDAGGRERAAAARQMRVGDDRRASLRAPRARVERARHREPHQPAQAVGERIGRLALLLARLGAPHGVAHERSRRPCAAARAGAAPAGRRPARSASARRRSPARGGRGSARRSALGATPLPEKPAA